MVASWLARLDGRRIAVEVPATSANLGAGLRLPRARARPGQPDRGRGAGHRCPRRRGRAGEWKARVAANWVGDHQNRFVQGPGGGARVGLAGRCPSGVGWRVPRCRTAFPLARGLGSSAAATIAGLVAGNALAGHVLGRTGDVLGTDDLLRLATGIEGHPDNAAAAMLGGFVVSAATTEASRPFRFDVPRDLRCVLFIPDLWLSTARDAARPAEDGPARRRHRQPGPGRDRRRRVRGAPPDLLRGADGRPPPRAVPGVAYPNCPSSWMSRGRRRARGMPFRGAGRRSSPSPTGRRDRPDRVRLLGRGGRHGPARPRRRRHAAERRCEGGRPRVARYDPRLLAWGWNSPQRVPHPRTLRVARQRTRLQALHSLPNTPRELAARPNALPPEHAPRTRRSA